MSARVALPLKVSPDLKERLRELAEGDHRNVNNYVEMVLTRHCEEADRAEAKEARGVE